MMEIHSFLHCMQLAILETAHVDYCHFNSTWICTPVVPRVLHFSALNYTFVRLQMEVRSFLFSLDFFGLCKSTSIYIYIRYQVN